MSVNFYHFPKNRTHSRALRGQVQNEQLLFYYVTSIIYPLYQSDGTNSPHMTWVDPGEGTFTCQVNHST